MALETLQGVDKIDGFEIGRTDTDPRWSKKHVFINDLTNTIGFRIQNGPIKENGNGVNGCQVDTMIQAAAMILQKLNENYPCIDNERAISHLMSALGALHTRKIDREKRGVEGTNAK